MTIGEEGKVVWQSIAEKNGADLGVWVTMEHPHLGRG